MMTSLLKLWQGFKDKRSVLTAIDSVNLKNASFKEVF
jgi:hypothetical protein